MMFLLLRWIGFALVVMFVAWIVPGISVESFGSALVISVVIGLINIFVRPAIQFITLPINIVTLGLFTFVINALMLMFAGVIVPDFEVSNFFSALLGSILLSVLSMGINSIGYSDD